MPLSACTVRTVDTQRHTGNILTHKKKLEERWNKVKCKRKKMNVQTMGKCGETTTRTKKLRENSCIFFLFPFFFTFPPKGNFDFNNFLKERPICVQKKKNSFKRFSTIRIKILTTAYCRNIDQMYLYNPCRY